MFSGERNMVKLALLFNKTFHLYFFLADLYIVSDKTYPLKKALLKAASTQENVKVFFMQVMISIC